MNDEQAEATGKDTSAPHGRATADGSVTPARGARLLAGLVLALGLAVGVAGVVLPLAQLTQPGGSVPILVEDPTARTLVLEGLAEDARVEANREAELHVAELPASLRLLTGAPTMVTGLLLAVGAWLLRRILLDAASGRPFAPRTPDRIRGLAVLVLTGTLLPGAVASGATIAVVEHLDVLDATPGLGFEILQLEALPLVVVGVLLVVAQVFRSGQQLTEDVEGLV
jgi:hypothetical protein